jgi:chromosome segregation ATPase
MEFAGSLGHGLLPIDSAESQSVVMRNSKTVPPAPLAISPTENDKNRLQITTPDIAYHADLIDAEVKQLQSRQFWMLNEALDVKDLNKKLVTELAGCKELCKTLNKDLSDDEARVHLLNESKCKLHEIRSKLEAALTEAKQKLHKKQQQLSELEKSEAELAEEITSKHLDDAQAEFQKLQLQLQTVVEISSNTIQQSEALISPLCRLESDLKTENMARDEMLRQLSSFREKKAALQLQCKEERDEIKALIRSAAHTKKTVVEKQEQRRELELALMGLRTNLKEAVDKKEKRGVELDSLMEVLQVSEHEYSRIERAMNEIQDKAKVFEKTILERQEKKNYLTNAKDALESEKLMLDKQVTR